MFLQIYLAENCFHSGIPEEETVKRTTFHYYLRRKEDIIRQLAATVPCRNPHWVELFHRWFLNMVAHWRGSMDKKYAKIPRYASFIATSNQKDLLTAPSGSRHFICIEVTGIIDTNRPIDYNQLYA